VYRAIPILGRCLDVGGNDGRLRAFLDPAQEYVSIDPYLGITTEMRRETYRSAYPFADVPMNFVGALAEYLPFAAMSFDTVHMRSVVDHFANPELAMREAFRVLKGNGVLVVGLYVKGGERGRENVRAHLKELVRSGLVALGATRVEDHHVWHPSYEELCNLVIESGFVLNRTHWQKSEDRRVCYLEAIKPGAVRAPRVGVNGGAGNSCAGMNRKCD
jgi:SAM-dependent methyltransferase